jgi:hypothetical protein
MSIHKLVMVKKAAPKRKPGRPAGRTQDVPMQMRVSGEFIKTVDDWRNTQPDRPSRSEAIRRLTEQAINKAVDKHAARPSLARRHK